MARLVLAVCVLVSSASGAAGSAGDADYYFRSCVGDCFSSSEANKAGEGDATPHYTYDYDYFLEHIMQWDPLSECEYSCMREISDHRLEENYPVLKYFGHWPYYRVLGLQEPASSLFSFCNAIPHIYHLSMNREKLCAEFRSWVVAYGVIASFAWFCSTVFHARKVPLTIFMDYASALVFLMFGLFVAIRRTLHFFLFRKYYYVSIVIFCCMSLTCLMRLYAMYNDIIKFHDHMSFSIGVATAHTAVWIMWLFFSAKEFRLHKLQCLYLQLWFIAASMLELFDFPPIFHHFDAHSLWHFATIPLGHFWYQFWFQDALVVRKLEDCIEESHRKQK